VLELRRLQALHAVVTTGSVKNAALKLGYSPSAISQHVSTLELETRTILLEPAGRGVRPTAAGRLLAEHAAALLDRMAETEAALAALNAGETGVLRLASFATAGAELVPPALAAVRQAFPGLEITVRVADRDEALQMLRQDLIDAAVIETHPTVLGQLDAAVTVHPLLVDPFRLVLPRGHPLADQPQPFQLGNAAGESWIDIRCEVGCCRSQTTAAFERAGFTPRRTVEADDYWPAQGFVAAGLGLALIPALALGVLHPGVSVQHLQPWVQPERHVAVATRATTTPSIPVQAVITALRGRARRTSQLH
jgi:DNA-binding transcriptional LysR family regulator